MQDLQNQPVATFVTAVGSVNDKANFELEGTAFIIGGRGFMLTAGHVAEELMKCSQPVALFFDHQGTASVASIVGFEIHPTEDVAILKLEKGDWHSIHHLCLDPQFGSAEVMMWAYPEAVAKEAQRTFKPDDPEAKKVRPDLIYFQGYIRRRISRELPVGILRGQSFYEVSQVGGSCASASPVTLRRSPWSVVGIYIGEQTGDIRREIGVVVRTEAFASWSPEVLGNQISDEKATRT